MLVIITIIMRRVHLGVSKQNMIHHVITSVCTTILVMMPMNKLRLIFPLLVFVFAAKNVTSTHFRGAVIMVGPKVGGEANEVTKFCV